MSRSFTPDTEKTIGSIKQAATTELTPWILPLKRGLKARLIESIYHQPRSALSN
jgi:hypothetical protein